MFVRALTAYVYGQAFQVISTVDWEKSAKYLWIEMRDMSQELAMSEYVKLSTITSTSKTIKKNFQLTQKESPNFGVHVS